MKVIKPEIITDTTLLTSSIAEPDIAKGEIEWTAGTYNLGDQRIKSTTHRVYQVVAASTTDDPEVGVNANPPTWVDVAPTNKWAMFDKVNSTQSTISTSLITEIKNNLTTNSISGFAINGATSINVTIIDPIAGTVYNYDISMRDNSQITDWYAYYFEPIIEITEFVLLDLPAYPAATVKTTITGNTLNVGNLVLGQQSDLGAANFGTNVQLLDFSKKEVDSFGNTVVTQGRTSKIVDFDVTILTSRVNYVFGLLQGLTSIPSVWVGDETNENDKTLVFGYYRDYQNNISSPSITDASITIEGLV